MAARDTSTTTTSTSTTTAAPEKEERARARSASSQKTEIGSFIPASVADQVESTEIEFVHDGKASKDDYTFPSGATVTERIQPAAPPHLIVTIRTKRPERDADTGVRGSDRLLDAFGVETTFTMLGRSDLRFNERNSIPLLPHLPAGDAPKAVAEGVVATG